MNLVEFLQELSAKNVELWVDGGKLRYRGPQDVLTPVLLNDIKRFKEKIIQLLQKRTETAQTIPLCPMERNGHIPLSFAQQRMWFLQQLEPESAFYNLPAAMRFEGQLNVAALEYSINYIISRHETLRTNFIEVDGQPFQVIHPARSLTLTVVDLRSPLGQSHFESELEIYCQQLAIEETQRPFDLAADPLVRASLFKLTEKEHVLLLVMHHIVSDGWSMGVLIREIAAVYQAACSQKPITLQKLPIQYADFAIWQQQWLQQEVLTKQLAYWKEQLQGATALLELPTDRPRPAVQTYRGVTQKFALSKELSDALMGLGQRQGVTLFMTLLAAFQTLLYRYSGQTDICVGTPIGNRNGSEVEGLIGLFLNTLVLRSNLSGNPSFSDFLLQVRKVALNAYAHQDLPFEQLVEQLQPERSLSYTPLFQVMFVLQNAPMPKLQLPELTLSALPIESETAKFDLTLVLENTAVGLSGFFEYNTDLFDAATIERMVGHYQTLLEAVVVNPQQKLSELPLLCASEQHQILREWNNTQADYPKQLCLHSLFEEQVEKTPDAVAVVFEDEQLTYSELNAKANQLAHHLVSLGVGPEVLVGICTERSTDMLVGLLAILKAGGAYVPLDPIYPRDRLAYILSDASVSVLLTQQAVADKLPDFRGRIVYLDSDWELIAQLSKANLTSRVTCDNIAYVIYTSGSTGKPKGVMVCHKNVVNFFTGMDDSIGGDASGTWLAVTSICFDISVLELFWTLTCGFKVVIQREQDAVSSAATVRSRLAAKKMDFSLFYFASAENDTDQDKYKLLIEGAKFADQHGFSAVWTPERHFHNFGGLYPNPSVTSAAIATITERIQIRAGSVVLPLHNPIRVAEEWSMVDNLSNGRIGLAFASGWHTNDFVFAPDNYTHRKEIMCRDIETVHKLWQGESVSVQGGAGNNVDVKILPRPLQQKLPIWITASGNPETFQMAGEMGANVLTHLLGQTIEELAEKIAIYRDAWRKSGHKASAGHVTLMLHTFVGEDIDTVREKVRTPFCNYLKSSVGLLKNLAQSMNKDINSKNFTEDDMEVILSHAFNRYFETSALFGTPTICLEMTERLKAVGVDELACLIDFGMDFDSVMSNLHYLDTVRQNSNKTTSTKAEDYSVPAQITRHSVSHMQCTPALARILTMNPESLNALGSLKKLMLGGEALSVSLAEDLTGMRSLLYNMYGPTETTIWSTTYLLGKVENTIPIGQAIANTQVYILDSHLQPVPVGVAGELHIGGDGLTRGYLNRPELTADKFIPNPFGDAGTRLYKTGDLVRYLIDGNIEYLGRIDHQVKVRGFRIELGEIEALLSQHPTVQQAVVIAKEIADDKRLVAYIVLHAQSVPTITQLRDFLHQQLPEYMVPAYFVVLDSLPLTPNGKVDRRALPEPSGQPESHNFVAPRTPTQEILAGIWASLLNVKRVGIYDNFFESGGHSLLATQLISRLQSAFAVDLPLRSLFEQPTVVALAECIDTTLSQKQSRQAPPIVRVPRQSSMPLSFAQQRLWFLQQLEVESGFYNTAVAMRFQGQINVAALSFSLNHIVNRHEVLRTNFVTVNGQPIQVFASSLTLTLQVLDLQQLNQTKRETTCQQLAIEEAARPFNLALDPLVRASLLKLGEKEHVLLLVMHHIVSDGWSIGVLVRELAAVYQAECNSTPIALPELPIQYADFAHWQQQWLQGEVLESQLTYWKEQLAGAAALLELPTDRPRPAIQTYRGATLEFAISVEHSEALFALSQRLGVTLFMTLLAAFQTLLYRYSGQTDICVGTPIANRNRSEIEGLIGLFVNTLVLRSNLSNNPSFADLVSQVREVALGAYAHQDLPFEQLVEQLQPERSLSHTPLFQVMFVLQNAPMPELELPDLTLVPLPLQSSTAKFDLTLSLENTERGFNGSIEYNTDLFDAATIERMVGHYQTLLEAIVVNPQQKLSDLPLLTATEQHQILREWNNTQADYPKYLCLHSLFEQQVEKTPDAVAVVFDSEQLTYRELNAKANQLAHHLVSLGVGPEILVAICAERSTDMLVGLLAILKAGGAYVPLDPIYPPERLAYILEDSCASVLLTQQAVADKLPDVHGRVVYLDSDWPISQSSSNPNSNVCAENLAYAIYTSGSTGRPKGVQIRHSAVVNFLSSMSHKPGLVSEDVLVAVTTITFDIAVLELFLPLSRGARLVLTPDLIADGGQSTAALATSSATVMQGTPATWRTLLQVGFLGNPQLKMLCGGEALDRELAAQLLERTHTLWNMYGPTETTIWSAVSQVQPSSGSVSIGGAIANTQFYILDANLQPVPVGVPGELHIGGDGLARGYLNRPELTADKFIPNPFGNAGQRLYKTGDLVRYLIDGNIEYLGRIDYQVKVRGFRIELGEIEALLSQHPTVQQAVVIAKEIAGDKRLVAYLLPVSEAAPEISELRSFLKQQLPDYMVPTSFVLLDTLPLTPNGKVDRKALPDPSVQLESHNFVAPRTPIEEMLANIWASLLGVERVGVHDNFFTLGGHSLLATQLMSRLQSTFSVELPLRSLFELPTVAALADYIATVGQTGQQRQTPIVRVPRQPEMPVSFAQQRLWFLQQFEPESGFYNIPVAMRFQGQLNVAALEQSLNQIINRHEALRTNFIQVNGQPMQVIASSSTLPLAVYDLQQLEPTGREITCRQLIIEEAAQPFDLASDVLMRASLFQLTEKEHVLVLVMHHIVSDGWSIGVLIREIAAVYQAGCNEMPIALPELPIQYADFAVWQQQWLQQEVLAQQLTYWQQQLAGVPALLELPTDRPRPAIQTYKGATQTFSLSSQLSAALTAFSQKQEVTLFMTLLAAFQTLLSRYSGQTDICVGTPIANRNRSEIEGLIGLFVNTLVLRSNLSGNPSFSDFLLQMREVALGAYAHQDLPFEQLVEQLQPQRSLSYTPLFQVMFVLQNAPMPELELTDLTLCALPIESSTAKFDLTLVLENTSAGLSGFFEYNTDLFDAATIERMVGHYQTLLEAVVVNPQQKLSDLPLLTASEQHQILREWNNTQADYPKYLCLHSLFEQQVEKTPDAVAVVFDSEQLTYRELNAKANQLAHHLVSLGVGPEILVAICAERSTDMLVGLLAILKAGGAYVPLDPIYPRERLAYILEDARVEVLLTQQHLADPIADVHGHIVYLDSYSPNEYNSSNPNSNVSGENLAYAIYTSGSTGRPKGVQIRHSAVVNFLSSMSHKPGLVSEDVLVAVTTITFDIAALELFGPLSLGARVVLNRDMIADGGQSTALAAASATVMQGTPATWRMLMSAGFLGNPQLKMLCGGEALDRELAAQLLERTHSLWNMYGPTETTIWSAVSQVQPSSGSVSIGGAIANTQFYILDANLQPVPVGVPGELHIGGDGLARGYLNRPELTADKFIPNPFGNAGQRLYKTGDLVRYLIDGNIEYLGRIDYQVKVRGFRIELGEIEALLSQHPTVQQAVVIAKEIAGDKRLVAYLLPVSEAAPEISELRSFLKQQLPDYMVPTSFVLLDTLPLTPNGKVDRKALPDPDQTRLEVEAYVAPRNEVERLISAVWQEVLNLEKVGVHDNFFEVGGHSLLIIQVHNKLHQKLLENINREISVVDLFKYPSISSLAQYLSQKHDVETPTLQKINDRASKQIEALKRRPLMKQRKKTNG
ncbi:amino acid adenylation domain-containing protein [Tolypothrix sp. NIES-4075]|uniref:non-ribosomal peptide synthetase n=1 Tax=Tolypothrix sp. NIES-4075 TaxID=2005459 RepID=UPI000B5C7B47|nr:non-ribosomal peptide synthetase [Tolypothrix sp. NIES-4075]GAX39730.1 amino acid adenylation domain-containing protein [Tolypothrix sp. NIES-4075]